MIDQPLKLPCGHTLANRLCKAAMTEGLADAHDHATPAHQRLYATWARGDAALLLSGNIMVDRRYLERAGNVALEDGADLASLRAWAQVVRDGRGRDGVRRVRSTSSFRTQGEGGGERQSLATDRPAGEVLPLPACGERAGVRGSHPSPIARRRGDAPDSARGTLTVIHRHPCATSTC